ncbi:M23 family metallopeptidase [Virgibacillus halodenitrificans]|uniref:M23 family metallopeptidase n=1 Tax=Virgibacillus halodenitrificans TaxID=1482 RepID=UPI002DB92843|nr:M23 family metallopeptidase [Virgibacillus halodenitrificans]MEC2159964.1 M23 family metallopeptidase [Virgibacillus halodenitrificans]
MSRGVKKVRQSIEQRKKLRGLPYQQQATKKSIKPSFPQDEEKHGYFPVIAEADISHKSENKVLTGFILKGMLSILLFFGVAYVWNTKATGFETPKEWTSAVLKEEFPFAKVQLWYQDTFGTPLALTPDTDKQYESNQILSLPVHGDVAENFQVNGKGIKIEPGKADNVVTLREGVVIFAGKDNETDNTVIVQHADGSKSKYGYLSSIDVHLYQFINSNDSIGKFSPTSENKTVYFSIEKDNEYIDPVKVIRVDQLD